MTAGTSPDRGDGSLAPHHHTERFSHAIYGLMIITALLVAEAESVQEPLEAIALVLGAALVLLMAHTYVETVAERTLRGHRLENENRVAVFTDNLPIVLAVVVPVGLFIAAEVGLIALETAFKWSIAFSVVALYAIGVYEGRRIGYAWPRSLGVGLIGALIGGAIILLESLI